MITRAAPAFAFVLLLASPLVHAAEERVAPCEFARDLHELRALQQSDAVEATERDAALLTLRKGMLGRISKCAEEELKSAAEALKASSVANDLEIQRVEREFAQELSRAEVYYERRAVDAEALESVDASKTLAETMRQDRAAVHLPLMEKIAQFILWKKNQTLVDTAERRFAQFERTIDASGLRGNGEVAALLQRAKDDLQFTQVAHRQARQIFAGSHPREDAAFLLNSSLESLSHTYQRFFALSRAIAETLSR